jgi:Protein of unknown function (DUF559)
MRVQSESGTTFRCDLCDWTTPKSAAIARHTHNRHLGFKHCPDCWKVLATTELAPHRAAHQREPVTCSSCGREFARRQLGGHRANCLGKGAFQQPGVHAAAMRKRSANAAYREQLSARMQARIPMRRPDSRAKMTATIKGMVARSELVPYGQRSYGNGGLPTPTEAAATGRYRDTVPQHAVTVGDGQQPYHYKLDLAWPSLKVGLDLDGSSHAAPKRQQADQRKDARLRAIGWTVLRVPNALALSEKTASLLSGYGITAAGSTTSK